MEYSQPRIIKKSTWLAPVTMNFAPPAVGTTTDKIQSYKEEIWSELESIFGIQPDFEDKRLSEVAKQI